MLQIVKNDKSTSEENTSIDNEDRGIIADTNTTYEGGI